jgi:2-iminoacetate synthase
MITLIKLKKLAKQYNGQITELMDKNLRELRSLALNVKNLNDSLEFFAPLYVSNVCKENCSYCGFRISNDIKRITLSQNQVNQEVKYLKKQGYTQVYCLTGTFWEGSVDDIGSMTEINARGVRSLVANDVFPVLESFPFSQRNLSDLLSIANGEARYVLFQETYNNVVYDQFHQNLNVKHNPDIRLQQVDLAIKAGWPEVGIGVLLGLNPNIEEELSHLIAHYYWLTRQGVRQVTISVPRINRAKNTKITSKIHDNVFIKTVYVIRILCPKAKIVLTARESIKIRNSLKPITHIWGVKGSTVPGGYTLNNKMRNGQFLLKDGRSIKDLC